MSKPSLQSILLVILLIIPIGLTGCRAEKTTTEEISSSLPNWRPIIPEGSLKLLEYTTSSYQSFRKSAYTFAISLHDQPVGELLWDIRTLSTGDLAYYMRFTPVPSEHALTAQNAEKSIEIVLPIRLHGTYDQHYLTYPEVLSQEHATWAHTRITVDHNKDAPLPKASVWLSQPDDPDQTEHRVGSLHPEDRELPPQPETLAPTSTILEPREVFLSLVDVFRPLGRNVVEEMYDLSPAFYPREDGLSLTVPLTPGYDLEHWGVLSAGTLVDWTDQTALADLRIADLNRIRKWGPSGQRYVTPESYEPSSERGFYLNPAQHIGARFLVTEAKGRFFTDFLELALMNAVETQNDAGYWTMTQRSNWLYHDYGIDGGYYDTRFSTDAATFLAKAYLRSSDPVLLQAARRYRNFLIDFANDHHHQTTNGGWFIYDYGHPEHPDTPTHTSLNHQLSEINFLLEMEKIENASAASALITRALQAISDTAAEWEKEDHDLAYAFYPDGSFGGQDYPLLTLKDLRTTRAFLQDLTQFKTPEAFDTPLFHDLTYIDHLIAVKTAYLKSKNLPLY